MIESANSQGLALAKKTEAPAIPAAPKKGRGRQQPSVISDVSIAPTETLVVFQPFIEYPRHSPILWQHVVSGETEHHCHPNTIGTSAQTGPLHAAQRPVRLCESLVNPETSTIAPFPHPSPTLR